MATKSEQGAEVGSVHVPSHLLKAPMGPARALRCNAPSASGPPSRQAGGEACRGPGWIWAQAPGRPLLQRRGQASPVCKSKQARLPFGPFAIRRARSASPGAAAWAGGPV